MSGLNPLNSYANNVSQKFTSGISYLGRREVCLLGGAAILICALTILMVPSWLYSSEKPTEKNPTLPIQAEKALNKFQLANGKTFSEQTILDETLILNFLTDPRASQLILDGRRKMLVLMSKMYPDVQQLGRSHPHCPEVQEYVRKFEADCLPFPYEEVFVPLLCLGVGNTSDINDSMSVKAIQAFQVRIFKYWLSLYHIGQPDEQLMNDLLIFCRTSSVDIFSKLIGPILEIALSEADKGDINFDYRDIIFRFLGADCFVNGEWASVEEGYSSVEEESSSDEDEVIKFAKEKIKQNRAQHLARHFAEQESKKSPGEKIVEDFENTLISKYSTHQVEEKVTRDHFSKDAIIGLFLEIAESR